MIFVNRNQAEGRAYFTFERDEEKEQHQKEMLEEAQKIVQPCGMTFLEFESHIKKKYRPDEVTIYGSRLNALKMNIVMNKVLQAPEINSIEELKEYDFDLRDKEAKKLIKDIDFDIVVYRTNVIGSRGEFIEIEIERNYEYISMNNGTREFWEETIIDYGVFEEDIKNVTQRFIGYVYCLENKRNRRSDI